MGKSQIVRGEHSDPDSSWLPLTGVLWSRLSHPWGSVCFGSPLTASSADPAWGAVLSLLPVLLCMAGKLALHHGRGAPGLIPAAPTSPLAPRKGSSARLGLSPGGNAGCPMPGRLCLLAFCGVKPSPKRSGWVGSVQGGVGWSDFGGCVTAWCQASQSQR